VSRIFPKAAFYFGGASCLSRLAVILASRHRYARTRQGRLVSGLAPPKVTAVDFPFHSPGGGGKMRSSYDETIFATSRVATAAIAALLQ